MALRHSIRRARRCSPCVLTAAALLGAAAAVTACEGDGILDPGDEAVELELLAEGLTAPVALREAPDDSDRLFVVDQTGLIRIIAEDGDLLPQPFLDLRARTVQVSAGFDERGLLGLAFHPDYEDNGRFYVYYSAPLRQGATPGFDHTSHVSEFTVSSDPDRANPSSERVLLQVDQPQFNHNGGMVEFGPDGYLYLSLGDGGGGGDDDPGHVDDWYEDNDGGNGQDVEENLLGSILRIDVDAGNPFGVPSDNPFVGRAGLDPIWAYGFRNPYRFSFDLSTGDLLVGDAGQGWQEVDLVRRGRNYGWNVREGRHCFNTDDPTRDRPSCPERGEFGEFLLAPVIEYANAANDGPGVAVVGGFVYRGEAVPRLDGLYVFGDYSRALDEPDGSVFVAEPSVYGWEFEELLFGPGERRLEEYLLGLGQDLEGELYVLTSTTGTPLGSSGKVYRIVVE